MILHEEPVADVLPVAVDRKRLAFERVENHQRNELLGKLVRTVVVRAVGSECGQTKRVLIGADEMIRTGLGCRIRAVRRVGRSLAKGWVGRGQRAVYVGADESVRRGNGSVDVALGGEVDDGARLMIAQQRANQFGIADVATHQQVAWVRFDRCQVGWVAGVAQQIEIDNGAGLGGQPAQNKV